MKVALGAVLVVLGLAVPALASGPEQAATELSTQIMSPFCPGVTLHECPSAEALALRDRIEGWFAQGMTRDQIFDRLEDEYGQGIRANPAAEGMGLAAWLVTLGAVALALGTGFVLLRRWTRSRPDRVAAPAVDPNERSRLDEELSVLRTQP